MGNTKTKRVRALSGAADEIGFLFGAVDKDIDNGNVFEAEHGVSSGAIIQFVKMCGDWDLARKMILEFNVKDHIFGYKPTSFKGILIALRAIQKGDGGLWKYNKLEGVLRGHTSRSSFDLYRGVDVWVGLVDKDGSYVDVKLNDLSYDEALQATIDSASLQLIVNNPTGKGDGGLVNHVGSEFMAETYSNCDVVSYFARTRKFGRNQPSKFLSRLLWTIDKMFFGISINNETETDKICQINGTKHIKHFMTRDVIEGFFKIKEGDNKILYNMGYSSAPQK